MEDRFSNCFKYYLQRQGYKILVNDWEGFIIYEGEDENGSVLVFGLPIVTDAGMDEEPEATREVRQAFEHAATSYAMQRDEMPSCPVRLDILDLHVLREDRGMLRHIVGCKLSD